MAEPRGTAYFGQLHKMQDQALAIGAQDPRVAQLIASGGSGTINKVAGLRDTDFKIENGKVVKTSTGGVWKPILAAAAVAGTGGLAGAYAGGAFGATAGGASAAAAIPTTTGLNAGTLSALGTGAMGAGGGGIVAPAAASFWASPVVTNAVIGTGTNLASNYLAGRAQTNATKLQIAANDRAAELQAGTAREALDYTKSQDVLAQQRDEVNRKANYDQWAAREARLGAFGQEYGVAARQTPGYVPAYQGGTLGQMGTNTGAVAAPTGDLSSAQATFNQLFPDDTLTPDMVKAKEAELKAAGFTLRPNAKGTVGKIQYQGGPIIDIIQGADSGVNKKQWLLPSQAGPAAGTLGQMAGGYAPTIQAPRTAALTAAQQGLYRAPSTLADYMRRT